MASIVSSILAPNEAILADHLNRLWRDLHQNHIHDVANHVDHADLLDSGPMAGRDYDHDDIDGHINAATGVHGLVSALNVVGSPTADLCIAYGSSALDSAQYSVWLYDQGPPGHYAHRFYKTISFGFSFLSAPVVTWSWAEAPAHLTSADDWKFYPGGWVTATTYNFTLNIYQLEDQWYNDETFNWVAIGQRTT